MRRLTLVIALAALVFGCETTPSMPLTPSDTVLTPRSTPIEFVGLTVRRTIVSEADFTSVAGPLFGAEARGGDHLSGYEIDRGLLLSSHADPRSSEQGIVTLEMAPTDDGPHRTVLRVPASYDLGELFVDVVRVALAKTQEVTAADPTGMSPWDLSFYSISANGGALTLMVQYDGRQAELILTTENPRTSLRAGEINTAAFTGDPYEKIGGTAWFTLSRDEFDFFSSRAYGVSSGRNQNFTDFHLQPHDWLRLTVTPMIDDGLVDVAFDVVLLDGRRVAFARSPASYVAGEQFRQNVFRMVDNMNTAEAEEAGSSTPWTVPFHYDDPTGGGVVRVLAQGAQGTFRIAYVVESPIHTLREVDFVPYEGDPLHGVTDTPPPPPTCADHGSVEAPSGRFVVRFDASSVVRNSRSLDGELVGSVYGSVFRAEDVTISGPIDGAVEVAGFEFADVDLRDGASPMEYEIDADIPAGEYQILGFLDVDGNGATTHDPDVNDPITLPIGGYTMSCAEQPITVEFALLLPEGY
ncbi:MAG: hypothetical protein AB7S26_33710 [Sandaracinaceae bacterium]